jgi:hypothetical protein
VELQEYYFFSEMVTINVEPVSKEKLVDLDKDKDDSVTSQPEKIIESAKN